MITLIGHVHAVVFEKFQPPQKFFKELLEESTSPLKSNPHKFFLNIVELSQRQGVYTPKKDD